MDNEQSEKTEDEILNQILEGNKEENQEENQEEKKEEKNEENQEEIKEEKKEEKNEEKKDEKEEEKKEEKIEEKIEEKKEKKKEEKKEEIKKEEINDENSLNKLLEETNEKCKNLENLNDVRQLLINYNSIEQNIFKTKAFKERTYIEKIHNLFYDNFFNEKDLNTLKKKCAYERDVLNYFFDFYYHQDVIGEIKKKFYQNEEKDIEKKKEILKRIQTSVLNLALTYVRKKIRFETIPNFIIYYIKQLFKYKVEEILFYLYQFKVDLDPFIESDKFNYLKTKFQEINDGKLEIFDKSIFDQEEKLLFFKIFILCNWKYINNSENNKKIIYNNIKKYITLLGLKDKFNDIVNEFRKIIETKEEEEIKNELNNIKNEILKKLDSQDKYLFFILSFSIMLNSLSSVLNVNKEKEQKSNLPKLKISSKERQFLIHLLLIFDGIEINYYLESFIYQQTLISYTKILYDSKNKKKVIIKFEKLIKLLTNLSNSEDTSLNDLEVNVISNNLGKFIKQKSEIFESAGFNFPLNINIPINFEIPLTLLSKNAKSIHSFIKYDINKLSLIPISIFKTSTQISILIDGKFSNNINLQSLNPYLYQNKNSNCDFYTYKWQTNINSSEMFYNKKVAKFYGKLLAYIITSRTIFKFQCINLIGFSLGCHVIKHCLLELNKISSKIDSDDVLNDVIFIGAATDLNMDKYPNILNTIGGRIINVYSENDKYLRGYNEDCLGLKRLVNNTLYKLSHSITNINLSHKNITQVDYLNHVLRIINDIKLY